MAPIPTDAYGRAKLEAEQALAKTGVEWAALRPVLVYGNGMKGNMAELLKLARSPFLRVSRDREQGCSTLWPAIIRVYGVPRPTMRKPDANREIVDAQNP